MVLPVFSQLRSTLGRGCQAAAWVAIAGVSATTAVYMCLPHPEFAVQAETGPVRIEISETRSDHTPLPEEVRGVYMTSSTAASKRLRDGLVAYAERNRMNAFVIDVKNADGSLAFVPKSPTLAPYAADRPPMADMDAFLAELGEKGYYRIARIFVFQDPLYARTNPQEAVQRDDGSVWADYKGVVWVDAASRLAWDYNVEIAREIFDRGFDEIQFDYIRFPSDGDLKAIRYVRHDPKQPKHEVLREFFSHMYRELEVKRGIPISYDLFGYVTWYVDYDLGIGQLLVDALPNATAISAMVYPSHYGAGTLGYSNPAAHPYEIIVDSLKKANRLYERRDRECAEIEAGTKSATSSLLLPCGVQLAHHRPWIQAFDIGAVYDAAKLEDQIRAMRDENGRGFLLWNARNVYKDFNVEVTEAPARQ